MNNKYSVGAYFVSLCLTYCGYSQEFHPNLNACVKKAAQHMVPFIAKGIPDANVVQFEPLDLGTVDSKIPNFKFDLTNVKLYGFGNAVIDDIKVDIPNKNILLVLSLAHGNLDSDYSSMGQLLVIPISGHGKAFVEITNIVFTINMRVKTVKGKDGMDHWKIGKHNATFSPELVQYNFTNLFNGNKQLGDAVNKFSNDNWKDIFTEISVPFMVKVTNTMVDNVRRFFETKPLNSFVLP